MNTFLNYLIESNLCLMAVLGLYYLLLHRETNFKTVRIVLLSGIALSTLVPIMHVESFANASVPTLGDIIPSYWLPEVSTSVNETDPEASSLPALWLLILLIYVAGAALALVRFGRELLQIRTLFRNGSVRRQDGLFIVETDSAITFSFFNVIFIGNKDETADSEKAQIIRHESIHARQWHSLDVIALNIMSIVFWYNPITIIYKKTFVQLHEFEADARAVEDHDVNRYCDLLARVALRSAGFNLASHFNSSLTIKRIEMMRTIKSKIKWWRLAACAVTFSGIFVFVACQDQLDAENQFTSGQVPGEAVDRFKTFRENYPGETFLVEYNQNASEVLAGLEDKYGRAKHIELFTLTVKGKEVNYSMLQFESKANPSIAEQTGEIFTVVDVVPEFDGGHDKMVDFLQSNLVYPAEARMQGIEGTVYVQFVVEKDGAISNVTVIRGIDERCDQAAQNVVKSFPNWKPGQQQGKDVRVRFVLPVRFKLQ
jgi:TonB family protein